MEFDGNLVGKCGIYCGYCRLYLVKKCNGCSGEEHDCPYLKCLDSDKELNCCGECLEFPCDKHYGPMAVYARKYLDWKKHEIVKA